MEAIKQFIMSGEKIGLIFFAMGIIIGVFKQHWLIAGVNTASKEELTKIDLEYVGKYFGIFSGVFGVILFNEYPYIYLNESVICMFSVFYNNNMCNELSWKKRSN